MYTFKCSSNITMIEAIKEALWLMGLLKELKIMQDCDNQSVIQLSRNQVFH